MKHRFLQFKNSRICYYCFGSGPQKVVCFHGYGEESNSYGFLEKYAGDQYTFYALDLPFHGKTEWNEGLVFSHSDLQQILSSVLADNEQVATGKQQLSLLGFSLG